MHVTMNLWIVVVLALFSAECYAFQARQLPSLRRTHSTASAPKSHFTLTPSLSTRTISASASKLHLRKEDNKESTEGLSEYSSFIQSSSFKKGCVLAGSMLAAICLFQQSAFAAPAVLDKLQQSANDGGFVQAFLLIFISEIGDKTFFIAALLAAKYGRFISFAGSVGALAVMTVISTVLGQIFHAVPASITQGIPFDDVVAVIAFTYFGLKTLVDASKLEDTDNSGIEEEKEEAEKSVESLEDKRKSTIAIFVQIFSLVFAAEIGDRSFLSTIALSAALNPYAVCTGAVAAHAVATGGAVLGGAFISKYLSEKTIGYIGGSLFLVFALTTAFGVF